MSTFHLLSLISFYLASKRCSAYDPAKSESHALLQVQQSQRLNSTPDCLARMLRLVDGKWVTDPVVRSAVDAVAPFEKEPHHNHIFFDPVHKFAMCNIPKISTTGWSHIEAKLRNDDPDLLLLTTTPYKVARQSFGEVGREKATELFLDDKAVKAVFLRDPLARFVSAFLNKCFTEHCASELCYARPREMKGEAIDFGTAIRWMLEQDPSTLNGHWSLQSEHCELKRRLREFNLVGLYTHDTLGDDASCVMEVAGIDKFNIIGGGSTERYWRAGAHNGLHSLNETPALTNETAVLKKMFSRVSAIRLMGRFAEDYSLFNFPYPSWIDEATGEWENMMPSSCNRGAFEMTEASAVQFPADDSIAILARRAGYF